MEGSITKSVKLPSFSGLRKDFQAWWVRFIVFTAVWQFLAALQIGGESALPQREAEVIDKTIADGKLAAQAKQRNGIANLTMAFEAEGSLEMIYKRP
jgi:hypothetical protein